MNKKYVDEEMMVMHHSAQFLFKMGLIDAAEMREFDRDCLVSAAKPARKSPKAADLSPQEAGHPVIA
jgi:DNA-binding transcriptional regulator YiaG